MSFTYDPNLSTLRDVARRRLGDTVDAGHVFENEEIDGMLARYPLNEALAQLAESIAYKYASKADEMSEGDERRVYRSRSASFLKLAATFRASPAYDSALELGASVGQMVAPDLTLYRTD